MSSREKKTLSIADQLLSLLRERNGNKKTKFLVKETKDRYILFDGSQKDVRVGAILKKQRAVHIARYRPEISKMSNALRKNLVSHAPAGVFFIYGDTTLDNAAKAIEVHRADLLRVKRIREGGL